MLSRGGRWLPQTWELSGAWARNSQVKNDRSHGSKGRVSFMPGNKFSIKQDTTPWGMSDISVGKCVQAAPGMGLGMKYKNVFA